MVISVGSGVLLQGDLSAVIDYAHMPKPNLTFDVSPAARLELIRFDFSLATGRQASKERVPQSPGPDCAGIETSEEYTNT